MKSPDCGNQRTGQPRCAQFTAKTWNCSPSTRRTQQAVSDVLPSVGMTYGFLNVASRVSPSGNSLTFPRGTQERYPLVRPRVTEEKRNPTIGTATTLAARALNKIPNFRKNPRREIVASIVSVFGGARAALVAIVVLAPNVARYSRRNKVDRDSGLGETQAMRLHRLFPDRTLASLARFRASRERLTPTGRQSLSCA